MPTNATLLSILERAQYRKRSTRFFVVLWALYLLQAGVGIAVGLGIGCLIGFGVIAA